MAEHPYTEYAAVVLGSGFLGIAVSECLQNRCRIRGKVLRTDCRPPHVAEQMGSSKGMHQYHGLRGLRYIGQPAENIPLVAATDQKMQSLEDSGAISITDHKNHAEHPYLIVAADHTHFVDALIHLENRHSPYQMDDIRTFAERYNLHLPSGFMAADSLQSTRIQVSKYISALNDHFTGSGGEAVYGIDITNYHKAEDGFHYLTFDDGRQVRTPDLCVCVGAETPAVLGLLYNLHNMRNHTQHTPPPRLLVQNNCLVPQMTLSIQLKNGAKIKPVPTVYFWELPGNELTFYSFAEDYPDGTHGIKIGYDAMRNNTPYDPSLYVILPELFDGLLRQGTLGCTPDELLCSFLAVKGVRQKEQKELALQMRTQINMCLQHIETLYGFHASDIATIKTDLCAYAIDYTVKQVAGKIKDALGIKVGAATVGLGLMTSYGIARILAEDPEMLKHDLHAFDPNRNATPDEEVLYARYQPGAPIPVPSRLLGNFTPHRERRPT